MELVGNRAALPYTIRWEEATTGKRLALRGDACLFVFRVTIDKPRVVGLSNELYVHLHRYRVSG
jgi:hypothetical protein